MLNPPIPPNISVLGSVRAFEERDNLVVMLGRFSEEKRYHWVVTELMPRLIKEVPNVKLVIFGGATTRTQLSYVNRVADLARRSGLNVKVVSEGSILNELDSEHQVYLRLNAPPGLRLMMSWIELDRSFTPPSMSTGASPLRRLWLGGACRWLFIGVVVRGVTWPLMVRLGLVTRVSTRQLMPWLSF